MFFRNVLSTKVLKCLLKITTVAVNYRYNYFSITIRTYQTIFARQFYITEKMFKNIILPTLLHRKKKYQQD